MAGKRSVCRTFEAEFRAAAGKLGEGTVREHLERLHSKAKAADTSTWEFASLAWVAKDRFGFTLNNIREYLTPYSPERVSEFINTYAQFRESEFAGNVCFDVANSARKAFHGFDAAGREENTPEDVLRSFVNRKLTARGARREVARLNRNRRMERCKEEAQEIGVKHPDLLDNCRQADCREVLAHLPENSVQLILHDPPYLGYKRQGVKTYTNGQEDVNGMEAAADNLDPVQALAVYCDMIRGAPRVLKSKGVLALFLSATMHHDLSALRAMFDAIEDAGLRIEHELFWAKNKIPPKNFERPFSTQTETIWLLCRKDEAIDDHYDNERGLPPYLPKQPTLRSNIIYCDTETGKFLANRRSGKQGNLVVHQFEKPVELGMYLVEKLSLPDDLVWDSCACHGNLTLAAIKTGRRYLYSESHPDRFAEGLRRIHAAIKQDDAVVDAEPAVADPDLLTEHSDSNDAEELVAVGAEADEDMPF